MDMTHACSPISSMAAVTPSSAASARWAPAIACCCSSLLIVFLDSALRLHAAHRAYVANIHETVCYGCAFLGVHRSITAGTSNDRKFAQVAYHRWAAPWVLA